MKIPLTGAQARFSAIRVRIDFDALQPNLFWINAIFVKQWIETAHQRYPPPIT